MRCLIVGIGLVLGVYQVGFLFRIIEETTHGSDEMPEFDKFWGTFIHGIKETLATAVYFIIPSVLIIIAVFLIDDLTGPKTGEVYLIILISALFLASLTYLIYQAAVLNMADYHGTIRSAFEFKRIFKKVRDIGWGRLVFIYLLTVVFLATVESVVSDAVTANPFDLWSIVAALLIAPLILTFIARTLGLINRTLEMQEK